MDGRVHVTLNKDDVELAELLLKDGYADKLDIAKQFVAAGLSRRDAVCVVNCAKRRLESR
jgi:hypothetical protein